MDDQRVIGDEWSSGDGSGVRIGVFGPMWLEVDGVERSLTARR